MGEFIVDLRPQSGVKRVFVVGAQERPRAAFRNWSSGDVDLLQRQARRVSDVAP
jgi:hypothetical protein